MKVTVRSPRGLKYEAEGAESVLLPGATGEMGVLPDHTPVLTPLDIGAMTVRIEGREEVVALAGGFAEIGPDKVEVLADAAERAEDIDRGRAQSARERAEERLKKARSQAGEGEEVDLERALQALRRAVNRIEVTREHRQSVAEGRKRS